LAGSTNKKVVVYRFDRAPVSGYLDPGLGLSGALDHELALLTPAGELQRVVMNEVKVICFVKEFDGGTFDTENRRFRNRPKAEGLWVQLQFRDNDIIEGITTNNLAALDGKAVSVTPPDASSNNTWFLAPRSALKLCKVLGVIGGPAAKRKAEAAPAQVSLFD
jgi:hypothetical protein